MKPLIGISCCVKQFGAFGMANHAASNTYVHATDNVVGGVPVLVPANGQLADIATLVARLDGLILTGSRSNVAPTNYDGPPHAEGTPEDHARDGVTLPLIRAAIEAGLPVLAICRGMQEMNVALGGSLHQHVQELPGRIDHRAPDSDDMDARYAQRHWVDLVPGGLLHRLNGDGGRVFVNSLHGQAIDRLAEGLVVEATHEDGTIEAVRWTGGPGFALGLQWHPEWHVKTDPFSAAIFEEFGRIVENGM